LNTNELADKVATTTGLTKADARKAVDAVFDTVAATVAAQEDVSVAGFGKFASKATPARDGRNPTTGATIKIKAGRKVSFSVAKGLKDRIAA
jgi:DNA-binding protein HU-beta